MITCFFVIIGGKYSFIINLIIRMMTNRVKFASSISFDDNARGNNGSIEILTECLNGVEI